MKPRLDVFIIGNLSAIAPASDSKADLGIHLIDARMPNPKSPHACVEHLNRLVANSSADIVGFVNAAREFSPEEFVRPIASFANHPEASVCLCLRQDGDNGWPWKSFHPAIAVLVCRGSERANILYRRQGFQTVGPFRDVDAPGWDWQIRAAQKKLRFCSAEEMNFGTCDPIYDDLPELAPKPPPESREWLKAHLQIAPLAEVLPNTADATDVTALHAGLFQWHDYLDDCHSLCQTVEGEGRNQLGDYWHAIMHRREPDYSNAKYWFRRLGRQPMFSQMTGVADKILKECLGVQAGQWRSRLTARSTWDPNLFVDLCETCESLEDDLAIAVRNIQAAEMRLLLEFCYRQAMGG